MYLPTLITERLILRPLSILDVEDMYEYSKTPYVGPQAGWAPHTSVNDTMQIIKAMSGPRGPNDLGNWAITLKSNQKMIGTIELYSHVPKFKAELGYALNPKFWGKGIVPEATKAVLRFGFEELKLVRIEANTFIDNYQSQRVCEKVGFKKEGIARNGYLRYDGKVFDKVMYGMTDKDYFNK